MAAAGKHRRPSWADLQPELVGLVFRRLHSLADRVRLGAVCRAWRRIAVEEPLPPPLPWLTLLDGTFLSIAGGGEVHRVRVPEDASVHGSAGNWLFLRRLGGKLALMNPFSGRVVRLKLPMEGDSIFLWQLLQANGNGFNGDPIFHKLVVVPVSTVVDDDELSSPDSLFAVLTTTTEFHSVISIGRRWPSPATALTMPEYIYDVAFFEGKLYALSLDNLFAIEIVVSSNDDQGRPRVSSSMKHVANAVGDPGFFFCSSIGDKTYVNCLCLSYLVESAGGRLLQVRRLVGASSTLPDDDALDTENYVTISFEVFELDSTASSHHQRWRRLDTLGDQQALFVGTHSKFLRACEGGAQEDCIYFVCDYDRQRWTVDPFRDSGVFNMRNGVIAPLLLDTTLVRPQGSRGLPTWFFPIR